MYTGSFSLIVLQFFANHTNFLCHFLLKTRRLKLEVRKYFEYKKKPPLEKALVLFVLLNFPSDA